MRDRERTYSDQSREESESCRQKDRDIRKRSNSDTRSTNENEGPLTKKRQIASVIAKPHAESNGKYDATASPRIRTTKEGTSRNRRMFGALMGHLGKARKQIERDSTILKKRQTKEEAVETKVQEKCKKLMELERQKRAKLKEKETLLRSMVHLKAKMDRMKTRDEKIYAYERYQSQFLKTITAPTLYYLPAKHTEATKEMIEASVEAVEERIATKKRDASKMIEEMEQQYADMKKKMEAIMESEKDIQSKKLDQIEHDKPTETAPRSLETKTSDDTDPQPITKTSLSLPETKEDTKESELDTKTDEKEKQKVEEEKEQEGYDEASDEHNSTESPSKMQKKEDETPEENAVGESSAKQESPEETPPKPTKRARSRRGNKSPEASLKDSVDESTRVPDEFVSIDPTKLKVVELRKELKTRGLDTKGLKAVLVKRLTAALNEDASNSKAAAAH